MKDKEAAKLFLLERIGDGREVLFGKFSSTLSEKDKQKKMAGNSGVMFGDGIQLLYRELSKSRGNT